MDAPLHISGLRKRYGQTVAVDGISFAVAAGEVVGLLGPNGAGKSTTIACLAGLLRPDAGTLRIAGVDVSADPRAASRLLGVHLQQTEMQETITVREAVTLFATLHGQGDVPAVIAEVGLAAQAERRFSALSQGQRHLLGLALALIHDPVVLVLDEPTAALDPAARRLVHDLIRRRAAAGAAVLVATHQLDDAERLCDRVLLVDRGRLLLAGSPAALVAASGLPVRLSLTVGDEGDVPGWQRAADEPRTWTAATGEPTRLLADTLVDLAGENRAIRGVQLRPPTLDDVFLDRVGRPFIGTEPDGLPPARVAAAVTRPASAVRPVGHPLRALLAMAVITLRLNARNPQALVFGFLVPVFFLIAFGSVFGSNGAAMLRSLGQVLTIAALGGSCFGLPIALVGERERGVWRRYRLSSVGAATLVGGLVLARLVLLLVAGLLVIATAMIGYHMPLPTQPLAVLGSYLAVSGAFIGIGLLISSVATSVAAVQALGQCLFLPMLIIGGVAVPLTMLPLWADHLSRFLPGRYAVQALDRVLIPSQYMLPIAFPLAVLVAIALCGLAAGAMAFRWAPEAADRGRTARALLVGLSAWLVAGLIAELWSFP